MKNKFLLLIAVPLLCTTQPAMAAYRIKRIAETTSVTKIIKKESKATHFLDKLAAITHPIHYSLLPEGRNRNTGMGLTSMILGIVGCALISEGGGVLGILAIIFGAIGIRRHEKYARAGLILGIVSVTLTILVIALLVVILSSGVL